MRRRHQGHDSGPEPTAPPAEETHPAAAFESFTAITPPPTPFDGDPSLRDEHYALHRGHHTTPSGNDAPFSLDSILDAEAGLTDEPAAVAGPVGPHRLQWIRRWRGISRPRRRVVVIAALGGGAIAAVIAVALALGIGPTSAITLPTSTMVVLTVDNTIAYGPRTMTESRTPAYLSSRPALDCSTQGCLVANTAKLTSGMLVTATCFTTGDAYSNADRGSAGVERNPDAVTSTLWYWIELPTGEKGYLPAARVLASQRSGLGLEPCADPPH